MTGKCATCKICVGEVWDSAVSIYLSIHHVQAGLRRKVRGKWNCATRKGKVSDSEMVWNNFIVSFRYEEEFCPDHKRPSPLFPVGGNDQKHV